MENCIFCKIVGGQIPNFTVYEDDYVLAFLDVNPCSKGHTVIIPKEHASELSELSDEQWEKLMIGVRNTTKRIEKVIKPAGYNAGINNRPAAGQAVPHVHWHIIPRYEKDGGGSMHSIVRSAERAEVEELAKLFK